MLVVSLCHCGGERPLICADLGMICYEYCYIQTDGCLLTRSHVTLLLMQRVVLLFKTGVLSLSYTFQLSSVVFMTFTPYITVVFVHLDHSCV